MAYFTPDLYLWETQGFWIWMSVLQKTVFTQSLDLLECSLNAAIQGTTYHLIRDRAGRKKQATKPTIFWANSIKLWEKKAHLTCSACPGIEFLKHLPVWRVTVRDTYCQVFPLWFMSKHNVFFLSFSPSRGATSIVYRCKQKGTQKPYALKVLKKTVSLFPYIITSLRNGLEGQRGQRAAMRSWLVWILTVRGQHK